MTSIESSEFGITSANIPMSQDSKRFIHSAVRKNLLDITGNSQTKSVAVKLRLSNISKKTLGGAPTRSCLSGLDSTQSSPSAENQAAPSIGQSLAVSDQPKGLGEDSASCNQASSLMCVAGETRRIQPRIRSLKVSRPDFVRTSSIKVADPPSGPLLDIQSKSNSSTDRSASPPVSTKFVQTRASQMEALNKLLNQDLTQNVVVPVVPLQRHARPKLMTSGPTAYVCTAETNRQGPTLRCGSVTSTRSILVKRDRSSRDISRLNDSCSPKKKVAFAKNKMVLIFTKDS